MDKEFKVPAAEIHSRKKNIQKAMQKENIDGLLILQRVDLFYFSGTSQNGVLYIPAEGEPLLFIKKYFPRARKESTLANVIEMGSSREIPSIISDYFGKLPGIIGFEMDVLPVNNFRFYQGIFGNLKYVDGSPLILNIRMIKSEWDIEQMKKAAELGYKTFEFARSEIRPGLTEMEFAGMYEAFARKQGHQGLLRTRNFLAEAYGWHILSGTSGGIVGLLDSPASGKGTSAAFPCGGSNKKLLANEPIMIDLGSVLNGYHMDETRMFTIGPMPKREMAACMATIEVQNAVLEKVKPGITVAELFEVSESKARSLGYEDQYLGPKGVKVSFIGHGIGLELVEHPVIAKGKDYRLEPGMTFALEPKMVFENEFTAGIEDVFSVTETGYKMISKVPQKVFIC
ncbi:M24 family metallopeptidase [Thermodesulfobacteriota bacterium]